MCRRLLISLLALLVASSSLWAFPGRVTGSQAAEATVTQEAEAPQEAQSEGSGTMPEDTSTGQSEYSIVPEVMEKASQGRRLSGNEVVALANELTAVREDLDALEETSLKKDEQIDALSKENASLKDETGTKAYVMLDGIIGFKDYRPEYGLGLTLGTRIGNSLMVELGADYMLGGTLEEMKVVSLDKLTFRAGVGWMF